jgi:hypothetical protein
MVCRLSSLVLKHFEHDTAMYTCILHATKFSTAVYHVVQLCTLEYRYTAVLNLVVVHTLRYAGLYVRLQHGLRGYPCLQLLSCRPAWMLEDFNLEDFRILLRTRSTAH